MLEANRMTLHVGLEGDQTALYTNQSPATASTFQMPIFQPPLSPPACPAVQQFHIRSALDNNGGVHHRFGDSLTSDVSAFSITPQPMDNDVLDRDHLSPLSLHAASSVRGLPGNSVGTPLRDTAATGREGDLGDKSSGSSLCSPCGSHHRRLSTPTTMSSAAQGDELRFVPSTSLFRSPSDTSTLLVSRRSMVVPCSSLIKGVDGTSRKRSMPRFGGVLDVDHDNCCNPFGLSSHDSGDCMSGPCSPSSSFNTTASTPDCARRLLRGPPESSLAAQCHHFQQATGLVLDP
jgi:hypothetical protein